MFETKAYSAASSTAPLAEDVIKRRATGDNDVKIEILYCGICHSDLHTVRNEWSDFMQTVYPCVPGHEIVGRVTEVGANVSAHAPGDIVGVGCLVDADKNCPVCESHTEQFCANAVYTYNGPDKHLGGVTYGGYSSDIVVDSHFVLKVPTNLELSGVAPLLCAGITTWSPLRRFGVKEGHKVGIIGLGGLGHMGVKFARAMGAHTVVFTRSEAKARDALELGAHEVIISTDPEQMAAHAFSFDFILDTVSAVHDINAYIQLLTLRGHMTLVGAPDKPVPLASMALIFGERSISGSLIGGIRETQEMLDFCGEHGITSDVEVIRIQDINAAYDRLMKSDVKYRFSIDMASLREE
ncbi:NAD(P)-dependent alcohol dehydrogenase [bacterium]|nr:NAD(P)-dependent alcohol dehydrogenase [bacterium]